MKKILFADFDGVLNHNDWWALPGRPLTPAIYPEPAAVLNSLAEIADVVCISSSWSRWMWQHGLTKPAFSELILAHGIVIPPEKIEHFGRAANDPESRSQAIIDFAALAAKIGPVAWAAIDDLDMAERLPPSRFFRIDSRIMLRPWNFTRIAQELRTSDDSLASEERPVATSKPTTRFTDNWSEAYERTWSRCPHLRNVTPNNVLEIGVHEGRSACLVIERMPIDGLYVGVDPFLSPAIEQRARENIRASAETRGVRHVVHTRPFDAAIAANLVHHGPFDLLYVDGPKDRASLLAICRRAFPLVKPGGAMIFDDAYWNDVEHRVDLNVLAPAGEAIFEALAEIGKTPRDFIWHETQIAVLR